MCIILTGKLGDVMDLDLAKGWKNNPHGAGVAILKPLQIFKGLSSYEKLDKLLDTLLEKGYLETEIVIHFRMATHGSKGMSMTHPFQIRKNIWLFHNGVLSRFGNAQQSDTAELAQTLRQIKRLDHIRALLANLSGKYCLVSPGEAETFGGFTTYKGVKMSNEQLREWGYSIVSGTQTTQYYTKGAEQKSIGFHNPDYPHGGPHRQVWSAKDGWQAKNGWELGGENWED
jgi:hypothetical protein